MGLEERSEEDFCIGRFGLRQLRGKIENAVREIEGVISASVSFMSGKLVLEAEEERFEEILNAAEKLIAKVDSDVTLVR